MIILSRALAGFERGFLENSLKTEQGKLYKFHLNEVKKASLHQKHLQQVKLSLAMLNLKQQINLIYPLYP